MKPVIPNFLLVVLLTGAAVGQQQGDPASATPSEQAPTLDLVLPDATEVQPQEAQVSDDVPVPPPGTNPLYTQGATDPPAGPQLQDPASERQAADVAAEMAGRGASSDGAADADVDNSALGERAGNRLSDWTYYAQVVAALLFVLFLIIITGYIARRVGRRSPFLGGGEYGRVVGRLPLVPGASLAFVEAAGRVLVVGVTKDRVGLVAEYDVAEFHALEDEDEHAASYRPTGANGTNFLAQLQQSSRAYDAPREDDEIASLRGDIQRLQAYLREESRESQG